MNPRKTYKAAFISGKCFADFLASMVGNLSLHKTHNFSNLLCFVLENKKMHALWCTLSVTLCCGFILYEGIILYFILNLWKYFNLVVLQAPKWIGKINRYTVAIKQQSLPCKKRLLRLWYNATQTLIPPNCRWPSCWLSYNILKYFHLFGHVILGRFNNYLRLF